MSLVLSISLQKSGTFEKQTEKKLVVANLGLWLTGFWWSGC